MTGHHGYGGPPGAPNPYASPNFNSANSQYATPNPSNQPYTPSTASYASSYGTNPPSSSVRASYQNEQYQNQQYQEHQYQEQQYQQEQPTVQASQAPDHYPPDYSQQYVYDDERQGFSPAGPSTGPGPGSVARLSENDRRRQRSQDVQGRLKSLSRKVMFKKEVKEMLRVPNKYTRQYMQTLHADCGTLDDIFNDQGHPDATRSYSLPSEGRFVLVSAVQDQSGSLCLTDHTYTTINSIPEFESIYDEDRAHSRRHSRRPMQGGSGGAT